jgi:hypothetical protein
LEALGKTDEAITVYRHSLYGLCDDSGKPLYDWIDEDGQSAFEKGKAVNPKAKEVRGIGSYGAPAWIRYALLLAKHRRYGEALYAYERGRECAGWDDDMSDYFDLKMTPETFRRPTFEAAARTLLGASLRNYRNLYDYVCPENVRICVKTFIVGLVAPVCVASAWSIGWH